MISGGVTWLRTVWLYSVHLMFAGVPLGYNENASVDAQVGIKFKAVLSSWVSLLLPLLSRVGGSTPEQSALPYVIDEFLLVTTPPKMRNENSSQGRWVRTLLKYFLLSDI